MIVKSFEEMERRMGNASPGSIFTVSGEEYYQSSRLLTLLQKRVAELSLETMRISPDDLSDISLTSVFTEGSLFSPGKFVVINEVDKISRAQQKELLSVVDSDFQHILFARTAGRKPSNKFIKGLEAAGTGFTCWEPYAGKMWQWTRRLADEEGIKFTRDGGEAAETIASGKLERLADVVTRVGLFHGRGVNANAEDVYTAVKGVQEANAFTFCEDAISGNKGKAMTSLSLLLKSGEEPIRLLALLYSQWKQAASAAEMLRTGLSSNAAANKAGIPRFRWQKVEELARKCKKDTESTVLEAFAAADHDLKTGGDPLVSISSVVLTLTTGQ